MKIEILVIDTYIKSYRLVPEITETDNKKIFELTNEEYAHFVTNFKFYRIKTKKLYFDEAYKNKVEAETEEKERKNKIIPLKTELCSYKELKANMEKYSIVTEEIDQKISELEEQIKGFGGEIYRTEAEDEI